MKATSHTNPVPVHINLEFDSYREIQDLQHELMTWTPNGGWSPLAQDFFTALNDAIENGKKVR